ncbi:glycosyltransferase [Clostridium butyricum]|uniref:Glycosyl transferase family 1 n=1 Tax=Clostridium butyricum TaxID=1492 RepID=A0A512THM5_CLOBU|nr:glycosyltransferase [Clostridium butyricum]MDB2152597.1 glycosyltransferase [Clostridium butyricum]MDK2829332.1 L-malate glycosyltransferase [Clostridium butyricum]MDU4799640.1 glycosyltransferase [Clostridium butyricum]NAS17554.1 glycosyltransferase [Clostridium butyricum]NOW24679.1 glycosyltransferase involved in cell wall biosynthesis [Clostridium butyricum]
MHIMVIPSWYASSRNKVHGSFFKEQFKALSNAGIKVTVAYNEIWPITMLGRIKENRGIEFSIEDNLKTYRYKDFNYLPKNPLMFRSFNKRMDKLYKEIVEKEGKIDIIHAHSALWGGISAQYISNKYNIPLVLTEHSSLKYARYVKESYKKYIYKAYDKADALIAVGNGLKNEMKNYTNNDIKVIHNMVDLKKFNIDIKSSEKNNSEDTFNMFSCAFLEEGKGMENLIEAFYLAFKSKDAILRIGGDGSLREKLEGMIKELGMENQIFLLGALSREDVAKEMKNCKCFALASEHETFGVVYIEALACGKPVIGTYNGGADDIIKDYNGIIIEKKDVEKLKDALVKMKNEYKTYDKNEIREKTILSYSENVLVEKLKGVYKEIYER